MVEIIPNVVDTAFLYFHTRCSSGDEIAPFVDDQASVIRSPLGMGILTGKFNLDTKFPEDDVRHGWDGRAERASQNLQRIEAVRKLFADAGDARTLAHIALAWIWTRSERTIPIPGFKTVAHVKENIQAMEFVLLSKEQMRKIDEIFERPPIVL